MATGRNTQLTKQVGEYLVACELARRGFLAATFSGNVPDFDLIVTNGKGVSLPVQVKTSNSGTWQFSIDRFVEIKASWPPMVACGRRSRKACIARCI